MQHIHNSISFLSICSLGGSSKCRKSPGLFCPRDQTYCKYDASGYVGGIRGLNPVAKQQMVLNLPWVWEKIEHTVISTNLWTKANPPPFCHPKNRGEEIGWQIRPRRTFNFNHLLHSLDDHSLPKTTYVLMLPHFSPAQGKPFGLPKNWSSLVHFFGLLSKQTSLLMSMIRTVENKAIFLRFFRTWPPEFGLNTHMCKCSWKNLPFYTANHHNVENQL